MFYLTLQRILNKFKKFKRRMYQSILMIETTFYEYIYIYKITFNLHVLFHDIK